MKKISVIVPSYNSIAYIGRCTDSILAYPTDDLELVVVDDGSTDGSGDYLDQLSKKDARVKVVHQENKGLLKARERGFLESTGKYAEFVDSDDWIDATALKRIVDRMESDKKIDCAVGDYKLAYEHGDMVDAFPKEAAKVLSTEESLVRLVSWNQWGWQVWNRIAKRELLEDAFDWWLMGECGEDLEITYRVHKNAKYTLHAAEDFYFYFIRENSMSKRWGLLQKKDIILRLEKIYNETRESGYKKASVATGDRLILKALELIEDSVLDINRDIEVEDFCEKSCRKILADLDREFTGFERSQLKLKEISSEKIYEAEAFLGDAVLKEKKIFLYGAGEVSKSVRRFLENRSKDFDGYIVSDKQGKSTIDGKPIYQLQEVDYGNCAVLLSMNKNNSVAVGEELRGKDALVYDLGFLSPLYL